MHGEGEGVSDGAPELEFGESASSEGASGSNSVLAGLGGRRLAELVKLRPCGGEVGEGEGEEEGELVGLVGDKSKADADVDVDVDVDADVKADVEANDDEMCAGDVVLRAAFSLDRALRDTRSSSGGGGDGGGASGGLTNGTGGMLRVEPLWSSLA